MMDIVTCQGIDAVVASFFSLFSTGVQVKKHILSVYNCGDPQDCHPQLYPFSPFIGTLQPLQDDSVEPVGALVFTGQFRVIPIGFTTGEGACNT